MVFYFQLVRTTATCYRVAKQLGQAKEYLLKASDCYKENRSLFHAARCYEQVNSSFCATNRPQIIFTVKFVNVCCYFLDHFAAERGE